MPKISDVTGIKVLGLEDRPLGLIEHVLFAPDGARVVGYEIERPALWGLIQRPSRFLATGQASIIDDPEVGWRQVVSTEFKKLPSPGATAKETGINWDSTVIWHEMDVKTESGERIGRVRDVVYGRRTGTVKSLLLSEGAATDAGVGRRKLSGEYIVGFDGDDIVVADEAAARPTGGGVATAAGIGAAVAKEVVGGAASNAAGGLGKLAGKAARQLKKGAGEWRDTIKGGWDE